MGLNEKITHELLARGAALVGFADLTGLDPVVRGGFDRGISVAVAVSRDVLAGIGDGPTLAYKAEYDRVNALLDELDRHCAALLEAAGWRALAKTRDTITIDGERHRTVLPYKTVATRAGLGWIGKCALLINERYGGALRLSAVLTDAPLPTAAPVDASRCGGCEACVRACPAGAATGRAWHVGLERDEFFDAQACRAMARARSGQAGIDESLCGKCIVTCPWSRRYLDGGVTE